MYQLLPCILTRTHACTNAHTGQNTGNNPVLCLQQTKRRLDRCCWCGCCAHTAAIPHTHTRPPYHQQGPLSISIETHTHTTAPHQLHSTQWCAAALQWHSAALLKGFGETQFSNHKVFVAHLHVHTLSFYANWCAHWEAQLQWERRHSPILPLGFQRHMRRNWRGKLTWKKQLQNGLN